MKEIIEEPPMEAPPQDITWRSDDITKLLAALSRFQGEVKAAIKGKEGYGYKYADIAAVIATAQEPLAKNGLCVTHITVQVQGRTCLRTILGHESGQWILGDYPLLPVKNDPQAIGSAVTYARRYSFMAVLGLPVADDDARSAMPDKKVSKPTKAAKPSVPAKTEAELL